MMLTRTAGCTGGRVAQFAAQRHARRLGRCYRLLSHAAAPEVASVEKKVPWLQGLNTSQEQAVLRTQGSYRVIAGPGSGKTKVPSLRKHLWPSPLGGRQNNAPRHCRRAM